MGFCNGSLDYIDFEECYQWWFSWQLRAYETKHDFEGKRWFLEQAKEWKEVGARDALCEPPFIEFYSEPHVRFEFGTYEEISTFRKQVWDLGGWSTFDLA